VRGKPKGQTAMWFTKVPSINARAAPAMRLTDGDRTTWPAVDDRLLTAGNRVSKNGRLLDKTPKPGKLGCQ